MPSNGTHTAEEVMDQNRCIHRWLPHPRWDGKEYCANKRCLAVCKRENGAIIEYDRYGQSTKRFK